jgi:hypothetical protein
MVWDLAPHVADPLDHTRMEFLDRFNAVWNGEPGSVAVGPDERGRPSDLAPAE